MSACGVGVGVGVAAGAAGVAAGGSTVAVGVATGEAASPGMEVTEPTVLNGITNAAGLVFARAPPVTAFFGAAGARADGVEEVDWEIRGVAVTGLACDAWWRWAASSPDEAATTALPTATAVATALTVAPVVKSVFSSATTEPTSAPWRTRFHRLVLGSSSSPCASVRRARKIRVSTAAWLKSISCEISRYERPCHSRSRIARRWLSGMRASASSSPIRSSSRRSGDGVTSWIAWRSLGVSTRPRRNEERCRERQTFSAILNSQADSACGTTPRRRPRNAFRNVFWTASSASSREPSLCRQ